MPRRERRRLGRPVDVQEPLRPAIPKNRPHPPRIHRLSADQKGPQPLESPGRIPSQEVEQRRRQEQHAHAPLAQLRPELPRLERHVPLQTLDPPAVEQRPPQLESRRVERRIRRLRHRVARPQIDVVRVQHQAAHRTVRHAHPLRLPRRPRRVDHVRQVLRHRSARHRRVALQIDRHPPRVQAHDRPAVRRQPVPKPLLRDHHPHLPVPQHERQPLRRVRRVQRKVRPTRLQDRERRHHQPRRALHAQPHPSLDPHPQPPQVPRQPVRPPIQLPVAQPLLPEHHRHRLGRATRLRLEEPVKTRPRGYSAAVAFHSADQRRLLLARPAAPAPTPARPDRATAPPAAARSAPASARSSRSRTGPGCSGSSTRQAIGALRHVALQIEPGRLHARTEGARDETRELQRVARRVLEGERHLEQRACVRGPEWAASSSTSRSNGRSWCAYAPRTHVPHAAQQLVEGRVSRQVDPQHQRVHEEADQALDLGTGAPGHGRPHDHVPAPGVAVQQRRESAQHHHEQRHALALRELLEPVPQRGAQPELALRPP